MASPSLRVSESTMFFSPLILLLLMALDALKRVLFGVK